VHGLRPLEGDSVGAPSFDQHTLGLSARDDLEVAAPPSRPEIAVGDAVAAPAPLRDRDESNPLRVWTVEITTLEPCGDSGVDEREGELVAITKIGPWEGRFTLDVGGLDVLPRPAGPPLRLVGAMAPQHHHRVDRRRPTDDAAAWEENLAAVERTLWGAVRNPQSTSESNSFENAAGIRISSLPSLPPASSRRTFTAGSSLRRAASTQPAEPAPTIR